ncbi:hypothetical protein N9L13_06865 [Flavobacteriales bacterium]|nr:hypothetical protein [Flavobacteriales bacterium]
MFLRIIFMLVFVGCLVPSSIRAQTDYTLTVEEHAVDIVPGQTTYRVYVDMVNETDFLSSVYGGEGEPLNLTTTTGFFNSDFGGATGGDINPALLAFFPDLAADSWLSIGLESNPVGDETAVSAVESYGQPFLACFVAGNPLSGTDVLLDDDSGGAWYILNGTPNGLPDENMQVIILQITTAGELCGLINVQVFEEGDGFAGETPLTFDFCGPGVYNPVSGEPTGCTDLFACNYDASANEDDGSCEYVSCLGCTNMNACNYNLEATFDDGSCEYSSCIGCTDADACNFDMNATTDNGSCEFPPEGYDCDGNCVLDTDGDGICDANEVPGCMDSEAGNYDPSATVEDGSCVYPAGALDLVGVIDFTVPGGGSAGKAIHLVALDDIEDLSVYGIGVANNGGGSDGQEYTLCAGPASAGDDILIVRDAAAMSAYFANCFAEFELVCEEEGGNISQNGDDAIELFEMGVVIETFGEIDVDGTGQAWEYTDSWAFQNDEGDWTYGGVNCTDGTANIYESSCLYPICSPPVLGCTDEAACNYDAEADTDDGSCTFAAEALDCDGNCLNDNDGDGVCNEDELLGCTFSVACNFNPEATDEDGSCNFYCPGCTDDAACNYDTEAIQEDGSCEYPVDLFGIDYVDCNNECLNDNDGDGVCDEDEVAGCTDPGACNYNPEATDQLIPCDFPEEGYGCDDACLTDDDNDGICNAFDACPLDGDNDADGDGVCANDEIEGCTDSVACNFYALATEEDGSCAYVENLCGATYFNCDCSCVSDTDGDGICNEDEIPGCEIASACNYNPGATDDDNSCEWTSCAGCTYLFACNFDADAIYSDSSCEFGTCPGCTDPAACNFNPTVSEDDGSCAVNDVCGVCGGSGPASGYNCDGTCTDADADGVCDFDEAGCTDSAACNYAPLAQEDDGSCSYPVACFECSGECTDSNENAICDCEEVEGCTDSNACNFEPAANVDDGSCASLVYVENGCSLPCPTCLGVMLNDTDGDGICDASEIPGCSDITACNYDGCTTDEDGSCFYAEYGYDCDGNCIMDLDGDCICDPEEIQGCTFLFACNYDEMATEENGSCTIPIPGYDCNNDCLMDSDGDGVCDQFEITGCVDAEACNYNHAATENDGTCLFPPSAYYDCSLQCIADSDADGICDGLEIMGCTDYSACNFNIQATEDDSSCFWPEQGLNCEGECLLDMDGNGVCDDDELILLLSFLNSGQLCGPGTYWNEAMGQCTSVNECLMDFDGSGSIGSGDLILFLAEYSTVCE